VKKLAPIVLILFAAAGAVGAFTLHRSRTASAGAAPTKAKEGELAPDLVKVERWTNTAGALHLPDLRGKVVLLEFWAVW
jgi:hypothetical protein